MRSQSAQSGYWLTRSLCGAVPQDTWRRVLQPGQPLAVDVGGGYRGTFYQNCKFLIHVSRIHGGWKKMHPPIRCVPIHRRSRVVTGFLCVYFLLCGRRPTQGLSVVWRRARDIKAPVRLVCGLPQPCRSRGISCKRHGHKRIVGQSRGLIAWLTPTLPRSRMWRSRASAVSLHLHALHLRHPRLPAVRICEQSPRGGGGTHQGNLPAVHLCVLF